MEPPRDEGARQGERKPRRGSLTSREPREAVQTEEQEEPRREEDEKLSREQDRPNGEGEEDRRHDPASQNQPHEELGLSLLLLERGDEERRHDAHRHDEEPRALRISANKTPAAIRAAPIRSAYVAATSLIAFRSTIGVPPDA